MFYHCVLNFFLKQINDSKLMSYIKKSPILFILSFGFLIPILIFFLLVEYNLFNFDEFKYSGFISIIYTNYFFNYKILKK